MNDELLQSGNGAADEADELLLGLVGTELNQVVFVMDYLQLGFQDHHRHLILSCYAWPVLGLSGITHREADPGYADALRSLIGQTVSGAVSAEGAGLFLEFAGGSAVSIDRESAADAVVEVAALESFPDRALAVWRLGEPPFD